MRTENDLVAALRSLEPPAPDEAALLRGVRHRTARRRIVRAGSLAGLTSLAAAVTAVIVTTGTTTGPVIAGGHHQPAHRTATEPARTAAFIVRHAAAAESAAARMIQVSQDRAGINYMSVATKQSVYISAQRASHGQPLMASAESIKGTTYTSTLVDYKDRAYTINSASTLDGGPWGAKGITVGSWLPGVKASDPASAYTAALRRGIIKVIGYRELDGRRVILIHVGPPHSTTRCGVAGGYTVPCTQQQRPLGPCKKEQPLLTDEVWLDASTYLEVKEVRMESKWAAPSAGAHPACPVFHGWRTFDTTSYRWLQPTKRNLAHLNLTPPPGFTQVSNKKMGQYLGPYS